MTDISRWQEYGHAHGEIFEGHAPATTMLEVKALIHLEINLSQGPDWSRLILLDLFDSPLSDGWNL